jgi:hypothetical protein
MREYRGENRIRFAAPWGRTLLLATIITTGVLLGVAAIIFTQVPWPWISLAPLLILFASAPFLVRGYILEGDVLLIERLFWRTKVPLHDLESAEFAPGVMNHSIRTFGNGGLFSFSGFYWNKSLRTYRAWVTDLNRTVIVRLKSRTLVLSPDDPEGFVNHLKRGST